MAGEMTRERWYEVTKHDEPLSEIEIQLGWHFCPEWDYMLVGPGMPTEQEACTCKTP